MEENLQINKKLQDNINKDIAEFYDSIYIENISISKYSIYLEFDSNLNKFKSFLKESYHKMMAISNFKKGKHIFLYVIRDFIIYTYNIKHSEFPYDFVCTKTKFLKKRILNELKTSSMLKDYAEIYLKEYFSNIIEENARIWTGKKIIPLSNKDLEIIILKALKEIKIKNLFK